MGTFFFFPHFFRSDVNIFPFHTPMGKISFLKQGLWPMILLTTPDVWPNFSNGFFITGSTDLPGNSFFLPFEKKG